MPMCVSSPEVPILLRMIQSEYFDEMKGCVNEARGLLSDLRSMLLPRQNLSPPCIARVGDVLLGSSVI